MATVSKRMGDIDYKLRSQIAAWLNDQYMKPNTPLESEGYEHLRNKILNNTTPVFTVIEESLPNGISILPLHLAKRLYKAAGIEYVAFEPGLDLYRLADAFGSWEAILDPVRVSAYRSVSPYAGPESSPSSPCYSVIVYGREVLLQVRSLNPGYHVDWLTLTRTRGLSLGWGMRTVHPLGLADDHYFDNLPEPERQSFLWLAMRRMIEAEFAETAGLPYNERFVTIRIEGHPFLKTLWLGEQIIWV